MKLGLDPGGGDFSKGVALLAPEGHLLDPALGIGMAVSLGQIQVVVAVRAGGDPTDLHPLVADEV